MHILILSLVSMSTTMFLQCTYLSYHLWSCLQQCSCNVHTYPVTCGHVFSNVPAMYILILSFVVMSSAMSLQCTYLSCHLWSCLQQCSCNVHTYPVICGHVFSNVPAMHILILSFGEIRAVFLYMGCFEKFSVLFPRDGYLFSTKFLYFPVQVGIYFEENFCICQARWNPFSRNFLYIIPQSCCNLHIKLLYISARWVCKISEDLLQWLEPIKMIRC